VSEQQALVEQIISGQNRQLQLLAASGLVPLPPEQLVPIQVALASSPDQEIAAEASKSLQAIEPRFAVEYLHNYATPDELVWFARHVAQPQIVETILRRQDAPRELLEEMAPRLWPEAQEVLLLRQDAIIEEPAILVALESNPQLSSYAKRRIWEYREHLLPKDKVPPKKAAEIQAEADNWSEEEIQEAIEEVRQRQATGDKLPEVKGLTEGQIRLLPLPVRMRLARGASRQLRSILVRDQNAQVGLAVLNGNQLTDQEVEAIANSRTVQPEVLAEIPKRREWIRKYNVVKAVVRNPRTQVPTAIKLLPRLIVNDLRVLARDRNVAHAVRSTALRLYQAKR